MSTQFEPRKDKKRRLIRQNRQAESRRRIGIRIDDINNEAPKAAIAGARISRAQRQLNVLRDRNPEEASFDVRQKTAAVCRLVALLAISVIDVLLLGAFLELFLRFQLADDSPFFLSLKIVATLLLVWVETKIAMSIQEARENASEFGLRIPVFIHTTLGLVFAVAMTFCVLSLYYTKIVNDEDGAIAASKILVLAAVGILTFIMHSLTVFDAEGVSGAASYLGYGISEARLSRTISRGEAERNRTATTVEVSYRNASTLIDDHIREYPDDPIPAIALTPAAANLINAIQAGTILNAEPEEQQGEAPVNSGAAAQPDPPPPANIAAAANGPMAPAAQTQTNNDPRDVTPVTDTPDPAPYNGPRAETNGGNNSNNNEADYYRNIVEAQIKDADGEVTA